jgi:hypothetical protein
MSDRAHWIGAPEFFELNHACRAINEAYGSFGIYLVGSSLKRRDFRDVDLRCILADAEFDALFPGERGVWTDARWSLLCCSISCWLKERTGLKIDFQFQRQTQANAEFRPPEHPRNALGIFLSEKR